MANEQIRLKRANDTIVALMEQIETKQEVITKIEAEIEELQLSLTIEQNTKDFLYKRI